MKVFMNANIITLQKHNSVKTLFKAESKEDKIKKFQAAQAKRDYVNAKTETIEDLLDLTFIGSILLGAHNIDLSKKLKTKEWFALGMFVTTCASLITLFIKKEQYAKEYDKEVNKWLQKLCQN